MDMTSTICNGSSRSQRTPRFRFAYSGFDETEMGKGVDFMEGTHKWHGIAPSDEQLADALNQLESSLEDY